MGPDTVKPAKKPEIGKKRIGMTMSNVIFQFEAGGEKTVSANNGDNLLNVARGANVAIDAPCSGNGACGKCRV